jgi:hypothetical protein
MADEDILPSTVTTGHGGFDGPLYEGDVIELFIRTSSRTTRYFEFEWSPTGDQFDARFDNVRFGPPGTAWHSGMMSAAQVAGTVGDSNDRDEGWTVEASIPLAAIRTVVPGTMWFFTVARYDYSRQDGGFHAELMMSTRGDPSAPMGGVTHGFHTYEIYDQIVFSAQVPEPSALTLLIVGLAAAALIIGWRICRGMIRHGVE